MLWLDTAMMRSFDPSFQIAENKMDHWQVSLSFVRIAPKRQHVMAISCPRKPWVAGPSVGAHDGTGGDALFDKSGERFGTPIRNNAKPQPARVDTASVFLAIGFARSDLNRSDDKSLMVNSAPLATRLAADKAFVDFYDMTAADHISLWSDHASAQLVKNLKGRFVASKGKLPLKLDGGLAGDLNVIKYAPQNHVERGV